MFELNQSQKGEFWVLWWFQPDKTNFGRIRLRRRLLLSLLIHSHLHIKSSMESPGDVDPTLNWQFLKRISRAELSNNNWSRELWPLSEQHFLLFRRRLIRLGAVRIRPVLIFVSDYEYFLGLFFIGARFEIYVRPPVEREVREKNRRRQAFQFLNTLTSQNSFLIFERSIG